MKHRFANNIIFICTVFLLTGTWLATPAHALPPPPPTADDVEFFARASSGQTFGSTVCDMAQNPPTDLTTATVSGGSNPRAESAVGWETTIFAVDIPRSSDRFWIYFAEEAQDNVDDATYNACWDTWVWSGYAGILSYAVRGDYSVTLAPTRWSD